TLNELISHSDNMHANIKQVNELLEKHFPTSRKKDFIFRPFEGFNAQKVSATSFNDYSITLYDYGDWAKKSMNFIRAEILPLRKNILDADARLSAMINRYYMDNAVLSQLDYFDASPLIFKLFQLDGNSLAAKVLMYKKLKADYLSKIMDNEFDFTQDSGKVIRNVIESSREVLKNIRITNEGYDHYRTYFNTVFNSQEGLNQYLQNEEIFWDSEFQSLKAGVLAGNGYKQSFTEVALNEPKRNTFSAINTRVAKIDLGLQFVNKDSLIAFGGYAVAETLPVDNDRLIAFGNSPSEFAGKKDVFVAKIDKQKNVFWLRKFMHLAGSVPYNAEISAMVTDSRKRIFLILKASQGIKNEYRIVGIDKDGVLLFDEDLEKGIVPRAILFSEQEEEILLIAKGNQNKDSYGQFENCMIIRMNMIGKELGRSAIGVKGLYGTATPIEDGFIMVLNFITLKTVDNEFINSEAIEAGGMNVLIVHLDSKGNIIEMIPVFAKTPVFASTILKGEQGEIVVRGKQGIAVRDSDKVEGGEIWEYQLKLEDRL
ncbi:MAG: hypothetical protein AAGI07_19645, partial [Bacteroidota bacterium]